MGWVFGFIVDSDLMGGIFSYQLYSFCGVRYVLQDDWFVFVIVFVYILYNRYLIKKNRIVFFCQLFIIIFIKEEVFIVGQFSWCKLGYIFYYFENWYID